MAGRKKFFDRFSARNAMPILNCSWHVLIPQPSVRSAVLPNWKNSPASSARSLQIKHHAPCRINARVQVIAAAVHADAGNTEYE